jgi:hypothetical protein
MARPRVADRGDGLQIWKVAANILNKQSRTADSGWSSSLGLGGGLTTLPRKTQYLLRITTHSFGGECGDEPSGSCATELDIKFNSSFLPSNRT